MKVFTILSLFFCFLTQQGRAAQYAEAWMRYATENGNFDNPKQGMVLILRGKLGKELSDRFDSDPDKRYRCETSLENFLDFEPVCIVALCPQGTADWLRQSTPQSNCQLSRGVPSTTAETYIGRIDYELSPAGIALTLRSRLAATLSDFWSLRTPHDSGEFFREVPAGYCEAHEVGRGGHRSRSCVIRLEL